MFQNGIEAIEKVLEVAAYGPEHSFIFFKAKAKEFLSEMLSQLTEWYSWKKGKKNRRTQGSATGDYTLLRLHID